MQYYTINGTVSCEDIYIYETKIEKLMNNHAESKGYTVTWSQFDPDSEPYTRWCEFTIETKDSFANISKFANEFKEYFIGSIQITQGN